MPKLLNKKFSKIKQELNSFLLSLARKNNFFVSITPVGSHAKSKDMEAINDIDIVFLFSELNRLKWNATIKELENFSKKTQRR